MTNERALAVLDRIEKKLYGGSGYAPTEHAWLRFPRLGRDATDGHGSTVEDQVQRLIDEATAAENLSQGGSAEMLLLCNRAELDTISGYILGWLPYW